MQIAATTRSSAYLTTNCQPFGSIGRISSSGRPPRCSTVTRSTNLEQARHERGRDAELAAAADHVQHHGMRRRREGEDHVLDVVLLEDALQVPARAEHGQRGRAALDLERVVVEEADRLQAELGAVHEAARHQVADLAGADDQRRAAPPRAIARVRDEEAGAARREEQRGQDPGLGGLSADVRVVGER